MVFRHLPPDRMVRALMLQEIGIIELGERSIRKFFEHRMTTYAAALAYRGLFGLFPFVLILVVLTGLLGFTDIFDRLLDQTGSEPTQQVPQQLEPVVERGREQIQPFERMIEQARRQAAGELLFFGIAVALWSTSALARTLTEAFNAAYEIAETRPGWKRFALSWTFGPILALVVVVSVGLMLIGPRLVERIVEVVGLDEVFVFLWGWLRFPVALLLLAVVVSLVYRFGPDARQRFRSVGLGATLAVVLWAVSSVGFSFYLATFADYGVTYGSLGAAVGLLFYLYLSASVVLLGAEVNAVIYHALPDGMMEKEQPNLDHKASKGPDRSVRDA
jgi:membrane protein